MYDGYSYDISQYARSLEDLEHSLESLENSTTFWGILGAFFGAYFAIFLIINILYSIQLHQTNVILKLELNILIFLK